MFKKAFITLMIGALLLAACSSVARSPANYAEGDRALEMPMATGAPAMAYEETSSQGYQSQVPEARRIVITNASLSLAVDDPEESMARIQQMTEEMGGFVVSAQMYQTTLENGAQVPQVSITIRVPAERLNEALTKIKAETTQPIIRENLDSQDVTSDYTDLESRLRNLQAAEEQLQQIMDAATKTEDVLAVYYQLTSVREQIEVIQGQINYYDQASALSAVSVELVANEAVQPLSIGGWQPVGVAKDALQTLVNTLKALANIAIWLVLYVLPTVLCVFGPLALILWAVLNWRAKRKKARAITPPPTNAS